MKSSSPLLLALAAGALLVTGTSIAQDMPAAASSAMASPSPSPSPGTSPDSATFQTPQGTLVVNSVPAPAPAYGPAPAFEQLSGGAKAITPDQASTYPPLANDFLNADSNKDGKISKAEYARWMKQL